MTEAGIRFRSTTPVAFDGEILRPSRSTNVRRVPRPRNETFACPPFDGLFEVDVIDGTNCGNVFNTVSMVGAPVSKKDLKAHAATLDFELFGITAFNPEWSFEGYDLQRKWIIMIGVAHDYEQISEAPDNTAGAEVIRQYGRASKASKEVATWIRERGWDADPYDGPWAGPLLMIPHAIECGFGELGKHGSIINKDYGSSFRLAAVLTDVPLIPTPKETYGVDDFCSRCQVCSNACPPDAILPEMTMVRGEMKWYVDFDKCIPFFNENSGCAICIAICPWSIPGRGPRIVEQLQRRAARKSADP